MSLKLGHATVEELVPNAVRTTTFTSSVKDVKDFVHDILVTQHSDATNGADVTLDGTIEHSVDGSTGWAAIPGAAFVQVDDTAGGSFQSLIIKADHVHRYIRYVGTIAGTSPSFSFGVATAAFKQYR